MQDIRDESLMQLTDFLVKNGEQAFRARQVYEWLWKKNAPDFASMTNISSALRQLLQNNYRLQHIKVAAEQISKDQSRKYLLQLHDGHYIEMVLIPSSDRVTVCISSQAGCAMACAFCATGAMGFVRNLSAGELYDQVYMANELAQKCYGSHLSNVVIMGMGEPLLNADNINVALNIITGREGMAMSPARITLSTAGVCEGIKQLAQEQPKIGLAVSLHSAIQSKREQIMPIAKSQSLVKLADALKYYHQNTGQRITFEYLLLGGINDSLEDAKQLAVYCRQFPVKINIIEYNENSHTVFTRSSQQQRDAFMSYLEEKNMIVQLRHSKGCDIDAACGQLANKKCKK
ncbi:MAG: 23S rRNA (adenine(2503)-C(2))-methyltransferase RlmN [Bacteroidales bacterium]|nr:23S rRNA (adenine(2503)-C(2))-methyltransferase RlmN [Bacteroidales bacterium]